MEATQCVLWANPNLLKEKGVRDLFELVEPYVQESHFSRELLKCRECGQLYFREFYEEIDWEGGEDPQYITYIPVTSPEEAEPLREMDKLQLLEIRPRLQSDWPKGEARRVAWVT